MRVIQVNQFGGPDVLAPTILPDPVAGPGQVVIDVAACDVLFLDMMIRSGHSPFPTETPYIPGNGVAGHVCAVGEGVDADWLGRAVTSRTGGPGGEGGYVSRAVVPVEELAAVPDGLGPREAAALLHDGRAAYGLFEHSPLADGGVQRRVLIMAAAGGASSILTQLVHAAGAQVIAAVRGRRKVDLLRERGADVVVDYADAAWTREVGPVDVVFDGAGGELGRAAFTLVERGGWFCQWGAPGGGFAGVGPDEGERRGVGVHGIEMAQYAPDEGVRLTARAMDEAVAGRIRPLVGQTFPLEKAADAHAAMAARAVVGKTLLIP